MTGMYGKITIDSVNFSWGSTQSLIEIIGGWDVLSWDEKVQIRDRVRTRLAEVRKEAKQKQNETKKEETVFTK